MLYCQITVGGWSRTDPGINWSETWIRKQGNAVCCFLIPFVLISESLLLIPLGPHRLFLAGGCSSQLQLGIPWSSMLVCIHPSLPAMCLCTNKKLSKQPKALLYSWMFCLLLTLELDEGWSCPLLTSHQLSVLTRARTAALGKSPCFHRSFSARNGNRDPRVHSVSMVQSSATVTGRV